MKLKFILQMKKLCNLERICSKVIHRVKCLKGLNNKNKI